MHASRRILIPILAILVLFVAGGWYLFQKNDPVQSSALTASGSVEAVEVALAPEISGRVSEVLVAKGDPVQPGDPLFKLDDQLLQAQRKRGVAGLQSAQAGVDMAQTGLDLANAGLESAQDTLASAKIGVEGAQVQHDMAVNAALQADQADRALAWKQNIPNEFNLPVWYFQKSEEITAAQKEVDDARQLLDIEQADYEKVVADSSNSDVREAEVRLSNAQSAFLVAQDVLDRAKSQNDQAVKDYAQSLFDSASSELEAAQRDYDRMLTDTAAQDVLEARARVAVAQARYDDARDRLNGLLTGEDSLQVRAAEVAVRQAQAQVSQAEAGVAQAQAGIAQAQARLGAASKTLEQAQAELDLIDAQIEELTVYAPVAGVILTRNIEPGEVLQPGATALTVGDLQKPTITVYLPEDRYGQISLGEHARVSVDSYPGETFDASVTRIADQAEFTPRNVQTAEGRRTTVFAVELSIDNTGGKLHPGMPADVKFNP